MTDLVPSPANPPAPSYEDLLDLWVRALTVAGKSQDTIETYVTSVRRFASWLVEQGYTSGQVNDEIAEEWWSDLNGAVATRNLRLSALRRFYGWMLVKRHIFVNPFDVIENAKGSSKYHKRDELTNDEYSRLLAQCLLTSDTNAQVRAIIALMARTGLRTKEVHLANVEDLQPKANRLVLWVAGKGHTEKDEFVVLPAKVRPDIEAWLRLRMVDLTAKVLKDETGNPLFMSLSRQNYGERLSRHAIGIAVRERMVAAGIKTDKKTIHSLRHSAITRALRAGAKPEQVQGMSRHADFDTMMIYWHEVNRLEDPAEDHIEYE